MYARVLLLRHGSCSSFSVARTQNNFEDARARRRGARLALATVPMDVTRKQRFGPIPAVSPATRRILRPVARACVRARHAQALTRRTSGSSGFPACGQSALELSRAGSGESRVKRTVYEKSTRAQPVIRGGYFLFTGRCGARATKQRKIFSRGMRARAEAYWLLERCCPVR